MIEQRGDAWRSCGSKPCTWHGKVDSDECPDCRHPNLISNITAQDLGIDPDWPSEDTVIETVFECLRRRRVVLVSRANVVRSNEPPDQETPKKK